MALTLVATAGATTANTYLTLTDAETLALEYLPHTISGWSGATDASKNIALVQATKDIDSLRLSGVKYHSEEDEGGDDYQPLHFPITDNITGDTDLYIPAKVERACFLQACFLLLGADANTMGVGDATGKAEIRRYSADALAELKPWIMKTIRIERG
jgi:hypothetical protein